jgi:2-polyprenyl-3-methyl-5-hydroxy-6-metoxy-1,4-benzoquinol methylase
MELPVKLVETTAFFSFLRMKLSVSDLNSGELILSAKLVPLRGPSAGQYANQEFYVDSDHLGILEALIDRDTFPQEYAVEVLTNRGNHRVSCADLVELERQEYARSSLGLLLDVVEDWRTRHPGRKPQVLDIGGRARSGFLLSERLEGCEVTVLDILPDKGVDVVADIHAMAPALGEDRFDFLVCVSVFEHLVMPWKAALEINKVLKTGGIALIQTHQTVGMHDLPWDYYRYSDESWKGLFNAATGFEIMTTAMNDFVRIIPTHYYGVFKGYEGSGGFVDSHVLTRKVGPSKLSWPVELTEIVSTMYPD